MQLTSIGRYAVNALIELARYSDEGPVSLRQISQNQGISLSYLEPIFSTLRTHGLVQSTRGPGGGYSLARDPKAITIAQIIEPLNIDIYPHADAVRTELPLHSLTADIWDMMNVRAMEYLESVSLASLIPESAGQAENKKNQVVATRGVQNRPTRLTYPKNVPNSVFAMGQFALG